MGRMIFDLTDDDREALERVRASLGWRSHAETLRQLIRHVDADPEMGPLAGTHPDKGLAGMRVRTPKDFAPVPPRRPALTVNVPLISTLKRTAYQKKGKKP